MNRFIKCKECYYNLSHDDDKVACSAGTDVIVSTSCDENSGCTSGAYTEEIFPDDDYDWEYDKDTRLPG